MRDYVVVPRGSAEKWWTGRPWDSIVSAASQREDGLRLVQFEHGREPVTRPVIPHPSERAVWIPDPAWADWDEICILHEVNGKGYLLKQNW